MHEKELRKLLVEVARDLIGVPYWDRGPFTIRCDPKVRPATLSCSQFVVVVFERVFLGRDPTTCLGDVRSTWKQLTPTAAPHAGDLAFFTRPGDSSVDPCTGPDGEPENWHVMMVSEPLTHVVGSCSLLGGVDEVDMNSYIAQEDKRGRRWERLGYRRFPF
jgi:hypothetical protein